MRYRIPASVSAVDEVEFARGMLSDRLKIWGPLPWDPMSWEFDAYMLRKWWFLIDDDMVRTTNFWRAQRGEEGLVLGSLLVE